jgi:uncharacterized protein
MLVEFKVMNFRSFRDEQVFSMVASADKAYPENVIASDALGKQRLLRSAVLYGANASGKSNFIVALRVILQLVQGSAERKRDGASAVKPFLLDPSHTGAPSEFELTFVQNGVRYQYGVALDQERVYNEWLVAYPKGSPQTWFERRPQPNSNESDWYFGPRLTGERSRLVGLTRPDALFLSVAAAFNHKQLSTVFEWFQYNLRVIDASQADVVLAPLTARLLEHDSRLRTTVAGLLRNADLGIRDFSCEERTTEEQDLPVDLPDELRAYLLKSPQLDIQMYHEGGSVIGQPVPFVWEDESLGTRRYFALSGPLAHTLQDGLILAIDELDASLHPVLVQTLVRMFHDPAINRNNAQLIFNTHDTTLLDASLFRRDQIWFVEKDRSGASQLYPLLEYSPRKDEALERGYLRGRYGAIPFVEGLLDRDLVHAEG